MDPSELQPVYQQRAEIADQQLHMISPRHDLRPAWSTEEFNFLVARRMTDHRSFVAQIPGRALQSRFFDLLFHLADYLAARIGHLKFYQLARGWFFFQ